MITNKAISNVPTSGDQAAVATVEDTTRGEHPGRLFELIKISLDVHATSFAMCLQEGNTATKPPRKMSPETFVVFLGKQLRRATQVVICYEAGPTGFWLARQAIAMGAQCLVVRPVKLDIYSKGVKSDRADVLALSERLDRHMAGSRGALDPVRLPTEEEELIRAQSRQRDLFHRKRQSIAASGRGQMLVWGVRILGRWWRPALWGRLQDRLTPAQAVLLEPLRQTLLFMDGQLKEADGELKAAGMARARPKGAGAHTLEQIDREVCDWDRFDNRKQPGSFAGLCGGVDASGGRHNDLSITKAGNPRLRRLLIQLAWRMVYWQPQCPLIQRWKDVLLNPRAHARARKKAIVAVARRLMVDLWRWRTGRVSAEEMGWIMMPAA